MSASSPFETVLPTLKTVRFPRLAGSYRCGRTDAINPQRTLGQRPPKDQWFIDLAQWSRLVFADRQDMKTPGEPRPGKEAPKPKPSRLEEARRMIEEYAADLRQIIKKLRQHLH
jgi:hypothetical protein